MQALVDVLVANGGEMTFDAFTAAARQAGARPENWLKAKHAGLISTRIVSAVVDEATGEIITPAVHMVSAGGQ